MRRTALIPRSKGTPPKKAIAEIGEYVERFLSSLDVCEKSRLTYRAGLKRFSAWVSRTALISPEREDILNYKRELENEKVSSLTLSCYLVAVRQFFAWAEAMKIYPNIAKGIKGAKRAKGFRKDSLTVPQVLNLLESIDRSTLQGKRDFAILNLLIRTALRTVELIRADIADIRQEGGQAVLYIQGKGRDCKDDFVLLTEATGPPLREYLTARGCDTVPLFTSLSDRNRAQRLTTRSISRIVKTKLRGIDLDDKRLTAHSLRHTAITLSLQAGASIQEAQTLGRHADINTTLIYSHNIDRIAQAPERKIDAYLAAKGI